ncbi:MAG TPA: hypothetical protein VF498_01590 [Anaerolineales bacterium]
MLDDFRAQALNSSFDEEETAVLPERQVTHERQFLGMSPFQRFLIALILLVLVCLLGSFLLLLSGKVLLPFL